MTPRQAGERFDLATLSREIDCEGIGYRPGTGGLAPPVVVFVRRDGWSLGACAIAESEARHTWERDWVLFARGPEWILRPMSEYPGIGTTRPLCTHGNPAPECVQTGPGPYFVTGIKHVCGRHDS